MPKGADKLTLSKMNMGGVGSMMMKWVMKNKNISTLKELITQAQANGVKFIACQMSMDVMGIKKEELIDGVEIGGVAKYNMPRVVIQIPIYLYKTIKKGEKL